MKTEKFALIVLAALLALGVSTTSYAFHAGGVAECGGCHSMHSPAAGGAGLGALLIGTDQSSTCLTCHERSTDTGPSSYHVSSATAQVIPLQRTPGGDFAWLRKSYTTSTASTSTGEPGATHGHNIVAADYTYSNDGTGTSPGGLFPATALGCNSCHDPHGKYRRAGDETAPVTNGGGPIIASGSYAATTAAGTSDPPPAGLALGAYRLLAGSGYITKDPTGVPVTPGFTGVPMAKVPNTYNRTEAATETRTAYGVKSGNGYATWSQWCGACHGAMHSGNGNYVHPTDAPMTTVAANYRSYVKSGDTTSNGTANGFTSLVPFASDAGATYAGLSALATNTVAYNAGVGPAGTDQAMCLTCHRAHASAFPEMLRWNMETTFIASNGAYPNGTAGANPKTSAVYTAGYYDRPATVFASFQRVLCNKCHVQD